MLKVLKIHANINVPISAYNVREPPEFPRHMGNRVEEHDDDDRFQTVSRNKAVTHMHIEKRYCRS